MAPLSAHSQRALVCVAEDDFLIRLCLAEALDAAGFTVLDAAGAEELLTRVMALGATPALLVTDIRLDGGDDGFMLAKAVRESVPGLPVIYTSGDFTGGAAAQNGAQDIYIPKPYSTREIVTAATALLSHAGGPA
jgi:DNA-binding response OmpR family regulator